ncbi:MAG: hypothetical protein AB1782_16695 [Cyanobacteriota bacterium]
MRKNLVLSLIIFVSMLMLFNLTTLTVYANDPVQLKAALQQLEILYKDKKISYQDYLTRKTKIEKYLKQKNVSITENKPTNSSSGIIFYDEENKPFALKKEDCDTSNWNKLNKAIKPLGFIAGPGGGYVFNEAKKRYYCNPCIKYAAGPMPKNRQVIEFYEPVKKILFDYAEGASYEYCSFSQ